MATGIKKVMKNWWILLLLGIASIALGIVAIAKPFDTFALISTLFVIFVIGFGVFKVISVIKDRNSIPAWGWNLVAALLYVVIGILIITVPYLKESLLAFMGGFFVIFESINIIMNSIALKKVEGSGWVFSLILGIITLLLGFSLLSSPLGLITFIPFLFGFSFIFVGIDLFASAITLSKLKAAAEMEKKNK